MMGVLCKPAENKIKLNYMYNYMRETDGQPTNDFQLTLFLDIIYYN